MDIGIGLPNTVPEVNRAGIIDWARRAEDAGFSSLGTIGRLRYGNYEELISLAAAAAVTERIRLTTDILLAPLHVNTAMLAKQTLTLDHLSEGRLVLGMAVGGREDDYTVSGLDFRERGRVFDRQLEELGSHWAGETGVGPAPVSGRRPHLLIGGQGDRAIQRAARYADGLTIGGAPPDAVAQALPALTEAWRVAGREGRPRVVALSYYALGPNAQEQARHDLGHYYGFLGDYAEMIIGGAAKDADTVRALVEGFTAAGADELILFPTSADPDQVDLLAAELPQLGN
ncbi:LLM class flavin-dependent oxidoreductase [Occultella glacieicola]|uniref:LLM class flavin-dependent oxidoreductase n=1 Tax=Occultella glacieicola TaxID=2518684 RepID=A0ABY2E672_9MICO|nr:LLM class flavin-dependent oxidoreductase [Occultella glacieicola]TDE95020.1 LLM class flavin-dependent oxidoreductase [Occultella glacieicola]